jgi:hypothetical protein
VYTPPIIIPGTLGLPITTLLSGSDLTKRFQRAECKSSALLLALIQRSA